MLFIISPVSQEYQGADRFRMAEAITILFPWRDWRMCGVHHWCGLFLSKWILGLYRQTCDHTLDWQVIMLWSFLTDILCTCSSSSCRFCRANNIWSCLMEQGLFLILLTYVTSSYLHLFTRHLSHSWFIRLTIRPCLHLFHSILLVFPVAENVHFFTTSSGVTSLWPRLSECQWVAPLLGRQELERQRQQR